MENAVISPPIRSQAYTRNTYTVVSKIAYLIGISKRIFENEFEPPKLYIYEQLDKNETARRIRNLCILRNAIQRNFKAINDRMTKEYKSLHTIPELVPIESIMQLEADGISILKSNSTPAQYIIKINHIISDRINHCRDLFPLWLNWNYIREIFLMPNGFNEAGTADAANIYYEHMRLYPYQMYMNWPPSDEGNIILNDKKFVELLYSWHNDKFRDLSKVLDAGSETKGGIYDFLRESQKAVLVVDCENSDPYKLCASLRSLGEDALSKVSRIILYDDVHSASAWRLISNYIAAPVEHILIERVKQNKSLVDIRLTSGVCREHYQNRVDSFIIASSDSDYWGLISSLPNARFLVMVESEKCGPDIKAAFENSGIFYCYLDDFNSGNSEDIKLNALIREATHYLNRSIQLNVNDIMDEVYRITRVRMGDAEKQQFFSKYIKPMHLVIEKDGNVRIELRNA